MGTPLYDIFDIFYSLIKDTDFANISNEDLFKLTKVYYVMSATRFKECKKNLDLIEGNDGEVYVADELTLEEQSILATGCVYYWLESKVNYNKLMRVQINTKDYNASSPANVLLRLSELLDYYRTEFFRRRKAYTKNYYDDFQGWN